METVPLLRQFGLNEKEVVCYLALLEHGPCSVRQLAQKTGLNRGTCYDTVKSLKRHGLVSYYHKDTKQYFAAEDPAKLQDVLAEQKQQLARVEQRLHDTVPQLRSFWLQAGAKPAVKYYEGAKGTKQILQDVLETVGQLPDKHYRVFSSSAIRSYLHRAWPQYTRQRIEAGIHVRVLAIGHKGDPAPLSDRKSMNHKEGSPAYILVYGGKVAMVSANQDQLSVGLIVQDQAICETHSQLFDFIWQSL